MKSLQEKVDELYEELIYCDFRTSIGVDKAKKIIRLSLKKQDRDTRHACADNLVGNSYTEHTPNGKIEVLNYDWAVRVVMNTNDGIGCKGL